jgi:very-long-chain enoyl-CoA reductase
VSSRLNNPRIATTITYLLAAAALVVAFFAPGLPPLPAPWLGGSLLPESLQLADARASAGVFSLILACWIFHYLRRAFEAAFIAHYKRARPIIESVGAPVHYGLFAVWVGWALRPDHGYVPPALALVVAGAAIFVAGEVGNFVCHLKLRNLRPDGGSHHVIPRGFLFEYVSCPHYFFEIASWVGFFLMTATTPVAAFLAATLITLFARANQAHRRYLEEFDGDEGREKYPTSRKALIPFVF